MIDMDQDDPLETDDDIRNDMWFKENYIDLVQQYPNQWIAVCDQRVIGAGNIKRVVDSGARDASNGRVYSLYFVPPSDIMP